MREVNFLAMHPLVARSELTYLIFPSFSLWTLLSLRAVSRGFKNAVDPYFPLRFRRFMERFMPFLVWKKWEEELKATLVEGSLMAFSDAMDDGRNGKWTSLVVMLPSRYRALAEIDLKKEGYKQSLSMGKNSCPPDYHSSHYFLNNAVRHVYEFRKNRGLRVDASEREVTVVFLIVKGAEVGLGPTLSVPETIFMGRLSSKGLFLPYPFLSREGFSTSTTWVANNASAYRFLDEARMDLYNLRRGLYRSTSTEESQVIHAGFCGRDRSCIHTLRTAIDGGCLILAFPSSADSAKHAYWRLLKEWKGLAWVLGGDLCYNTKDVEMPLSEAMINVDWTGMLYFKR